MLEPIADLIREYVISCNQIHGDDTPVKVLNPGTKKTKTGRMWVYVNDGRPRGDDRLLLLDIITAQIEKEKDQKNI